MRSASSDMLIIDGSHGEGGGQILRTALSLAAITGRPMRIDRIRAGRRKPGLAAQHLTAIRAAATIVHAAVKGDSLGSEALEFCPAAPTIAGSYHFDVAEAREGGSAGSAPLVLQTVALPLALAGGGGSVTVRGGTHVPWSPSFDYLQQVWLEMLRRHGLEAAVELKAWGFYPAGEGEIALHLGRTRTLRPMTLAQCGPLVAIDGRAVAASLPSHIAQRMADRARALLEPLGVPVTVNTERVRAASPGAWLFLRSIHENAVAGFGALGRRGKPSEEVAGEAVNGLLAHHRAGAPVDRHLADQLLLPLTFAEGISEFICAAVTRHLQTNAWVIEQFEAAHIEIAEGPTGAGYVKVRPNGSHSAAAMKVT